MRTVLVTGGAGFIGSHFVRHLFAHAPDTRILVLDLLTYAGNPDNLDDAVKASDRFEFWYGNVNNAALVHAVMARADAVVHFAAESHVARSIFDDRIFFETDVLGTQTMASAALAHGVERFIHISTSEVYGTAQSDPMDELHPLDPMTPYAAAKAGADRLIYSYQRTYGLPAVIVRPFNQFGPNQHLEKVVPRFVTSALRDEPLTVHGDGSSRRDWTYVTDTCRAIHALLEAPLERVAGETINLGTGRATDVVTIAEHIVERLGKPASLIQRMDDRPGQVQHHRADAEKAARLLGWRPEVDFETGLDRTLAWYRDHPAWWEKIAWMKHVQIKDRDGTIKLY